MPLYPKVNSQFTQQELIDAFGGYDHRLKIPDGAWYDTKNLTTDYAPLLSSRQKRGDTHIRAVSLLEKNALAYVSEAGTLFYNFLPTPVTGLSAGEKQLVGMGAYLVIFPDKVYFNTEDQTDYGSLEAHFAPLRAAYQMVRHDGTAISVRGVQPEAPAEPQNAEYWIDTSGETHVLRQWSEAQGEWVAVETAYVRITFESMGSVPQLFRAGDGVTIAGSSVGVNGDKIIHAVGGGENEADWITVTGLLDSIPDEPDSALTIDRGVPDMDYVCECRNRLWGCRYGIGADGRAINEIFCCALGDFTNWRQYSGLSTDSWTGSVGSDGPWTGAVNYLGYPTFFKENRIHRVTVSPEGAHRIDETVCRGVQKGSAKSLVVVNETLYYKSCSDVCAYQGGFPRGISAALGAVPYHAAVGGAVGNKYYLSVLDEDERPVLFVYDIEKDLWLREDALRVTDFARVGDELYAVAGYDEGRGLFDTTLSGPLVSFTCASASRPLKELSVTIAAIQEGSGDPSLENIRPVRGWSGAEITLSPAQNIAGGTVYPVSWQMNAGLVYGGEMDVTHGILTVTHTCIRLTDRTVWMTSSSVAGRYLLNNTDSRNLVKGQTGFLCSHFKPAASSSMTGTVYVSSGPNVVFNTPFATMAEWQAYLGEQEAAGTPVMCVCKLAVPQVYQLPAREVRTIPGENTVQCDAGEVCLTYVDHDPGDFSLRTLCGSLPIDGATAEEEVAWEAVSGMLYYEYPENKRASRYNIRLKIDRGAALAVYVQYDSDGVWRCAGSLSAAGDGGTDSYLFPVRPHRCDHLQLKLCGRGAVRIYSIARILEVGSDYR